MTFRKYICTACFKLFAKNAALGILTQCPHCKTPDALSPRGQFERKQPWPRDSFDLSVTTDKIDHVPIRYSRKTQGEFA